MLRCVDFRCDWCGKTEEHILVVNEDPMPKHCKYTMRRVIGAPMVHYKPHYSHALGREVNRYSEEEKALEAKGQWIASKTEAARMYDTDIADNAVVQPVTQEAIRKTVEKQAQRLVADGVLPGSSEW